MRGAAKMIGGISKLAKPFVYFFLIITVMAPSAFALSQDQTNIFDSGIDYFDVSQGGAGG